MTGKRSSRRRKHKTPRYPTLAASPVWLIGIFALLSAYFAYGIRNLIAMLSPIAAAGINKIGWWNWRSIVVSGVLCGLVAYWVSAVLLFDRCQRLLRRKCFV